MADSINNNDLDVEFRATVKDDTKKGLDSIVRSFKSALSPIDKKIIEAQKSLNRAKREETKAKYRTKIDQLEAEAKRTRSPQQQFSLVASQILSKVDLKNLNPKTLKSVVKEIEDLANYLDRAGVKGIDTSYIDAIRNLIPISEQETKEKSKLAKQQERLNKLSTDYLNILKETSKFGATKDGIFAKSTSLSLAEAKKLRSDARKGQLKSIAINDKGGATQFESISDAADAIINKYKQIGDEWNELIGVKLTKNDKLRARLQELEADLDDVEKEYEQIRISGGEASDELKTKAKNLSKEIENTKKKLKPSWIQKLGNTFKRIGFYRLARNVFRLIANTFNEGIQMFATFDKSANETMSDITGSFQVIKASIGAMTMSVIQMFAPAIRDVATAFADVANNISMAVSQMQGLKTYTKINADYMKEYGQQTKNALLSFDKFEALSQQDENEGLFTKEPIDESNEKSKVWQHTLGTIKGIVDIIWTIIKSIGESLKDIFENYILPNASELIAIAEGIVKFVGDIIKGLISAMGWVARNVEIATSLGIVIAQIVGLIAAAKGNWALFAKAQLATVGILGAGAYISASKAKNAATLPTPTNPEPTAGSQIGDSMVESLATTSGLYNQDSVIESNLYIDGELVARSRGLKRELNRTNPNLNLV